MELCDALDVSTKYYCYPEFKIRIESPGGQVQALSHALGKLQTLGVNCAGESPNENGIVIRTEGFTTVASAAAILLSMGTVGCRTCYETCKLCYHGARVRWNTDITKEKADEIYRQLKESDEIIITKLLAQAIRSLELSFEERIRNNTIYFHINRSIQGKKSSSCFSVVYRNEFKKLSSFYDNIIDKGTTDKKVISALKRYLKKVYHRLYSDDVFIDSEEAQFLLLVDEII